MAVLRDTLCLASLNRIPPCWRDCASFAEAPNLDHCLRCWLSSGSRRKCSSVFFSVQRNLGIFRIWQNFIHHSEVCSRHGPRLRLGQHIAVSSPLTKQPMPCVNTMPVFPACWKIFRTVGCRVPSHSWSQSTCRGLFRIKPSTIESRGRPPSCFPDTLEAALDSRGSG